MTGFRSVVFDVDSTLAGIEGIDWLAARKSPAVAAKVAELTQRAMEGSVDLDAVYGERLNAVAPSAKEVEDLGAAYVAAIAPEAKEVLDTLIANGVEVRMVSGGLRPPVERLARELGVASKNAHAVDVFFDESGGYSRYDAQSPLTRQTGKREIVETMRLPHPILGVGDGMTDLEMKPAVDKFAAFTGFASRAGVTARADYTISRLEELIPLVLP